MSALIFRLGAPATIEAGRFGPKAANLARLRRAGLPVPDGFCVDAEAYRSQMRALVLAESAHGVFSPGDAALARRRALEIRLALLEAPLIPELEAALLASRRELIERCGPLVAVRSSALVEDRYGSSFAGQFESYIGVESEHDFLTAVRSCWAALWATRALRYMAGHDIDPADTAMAVLVQPLVDARVSGGGLSATAAGGMRLTATWGLGESIAQGEVTPDRYELDTDGALIEVVAGRKDHSVGCAHHSMPLMRSIGRRRAAEVCLSDLQITELARLLRATADFMRMPVEIEWALDEAGFRLLQSRPLHVGQCAEPDGLWLHHPRMNGHPAGVGWGVGRACVINCECELGRLAAGDVLVTRAASPALVQFLPAVAGIVAERGGSTSHLASLARERGIPMVLGVHEATARIPDGARVAVDGVAGVVQWMPS